MQSATQGETGAQPPAATLVALLSHDPAAVGARAHHRFAEARAFPALAPARGSLTPWQMHRVTAYVREKIDGPVPVQEMARAARLSPSYFHRAFKRSFGATPHDYVLRRRVERARRVMLETPAPLAQVALDCGFSDQAHLCRVFRALVGESPSLWRRRNRAAQSAFCRPCSETRDVSI